MFMVKQSIGCIILHDKDIVIHFLPYSRVTTVRQTGIHYLPFISLTKIPGLSMLPRCNT